MQQFERTSRGTAESDIFFAIALGLLLVFGTQFIQRSQRISSERLTDSVPAQAKVVAWGECKFLYKKKRESYFSISGTYQYQAAPSSTLYEIESETKFRGGGEQKCPDMFLTIARAHSIIDIVYERINPNENRRLPLEPYVQGIDFLAALGVTVFALFGYKYMNPAQQVKRVRIQSKRRKK